MIEKELRQIKTSKLVLDLENPRLKHQAIAGNKPLNQEDLEIMIAAETDFNKLKKSIMKKGVDNPIWVSKQKDGTYLVEEGNRRTTSLKSLIEKQITPPEGVRYDVVDAWVFGPNTTRLEIQLQKVSLQTGTKPWQRANVCSMIHDFHYDHMMAMDDIATSMQISETAVKKALRSYKMWLDYVEDTGDTKPDRFSMFDGITKPVLDWVLANPANKQDFHRWICPIGGQAKIKSASTRGGLRDFGKVVGDPDAIALLREDPRATIEDALELVKSNDILKDMIFLNRLLPMAKNLDELDDSQRARLAQEPRLKVHIRSLRDACSVLLNDLEDLEN